MYIGDIMQQLQEHPGSTWQHRMAVLLRHKAPAIKPDQHEQLQKLPGSTGAPRKGAPYLPPSLLNLGGSNFFAHYCI